MVINIVSLNVRGLRNQIKRKGIFDYYRGKCNLLFLQETHSVKEDENIWKSEWGNKIIFSHGTSASRGVMCLVSKQIQIDINNVKCDAHGRYIIFAVWHEDCAYSIANIYAPNTDNPTFFQEVIRETYNRSENVVIVGDFNTVIQPKLDRNSECKSHNNNRSAQMIRNLCEELQLQDIWRVRNPESRRYSWYRGTKKIQASRIDYSLTSVGLSHSIHNCFYLAGINTDHSAYFVGIDKKQISRGPGYWKFNTSFLADIDFVKKAKRKLEELKMENMYIQRAIERWEILKRDFKAFCADYAKKIASEEKIAISQLSEKVAEMEEELSSLSEEEVKILHQSQIDLDALIDKRARGILFRSKARWYMESEKNTQYFYSLEKSRYNSKTCLKLFREDGSLEDREESILEMQKDFYQKLYTADKSVKFDLPNNLDCQLDESMEGSWEIPFSEAEISTAIKQLKNGSCPGLDGFPIEVYKMFYQEMRVPVIEMIEESFLEQKIPESMSKGVLNLIPKGEKDTRHLKNLRPITLLNSDYKIIEKLIANRMVPALEQLINEDQCGFLPNRRIVANIRKILDIISESKDSENIILTCDYMKCFDMVEWTAIENSMEFFGFSKMLRKWVKILYQGFSLQVQNNGNLSEKIDVGRSVRQGGPASNALFLVIAELLANNIRKDADISGIFIREIEQLLNQYADDMDVGMENSETSLNAALNQIERFRRSTGFTLNYDKTTIYRVGSLAHTCARLYTEKQLTWTSETINVLGVDIYQNTEQLIKVNYDKIVRKCDSILGSWANRSLSLVGKVNVINTLIGSLFVYKMSALPPIPNNIVEVLEQKFEAFIWNGRKPKISLATLQTAKSRGGLQLVNLKVKDVSLKATWPKMIVEGRYPTELAYRLIHREAKANIWTCNLHEKDVEKVIQTTDPFWIGVLKAWCKFHYQDRIDQQKDHIIWLNSKIRIGGTPVWWDKCEKAGLKYVSDLVKDGEYISEEAANKEYHLTIMEYNSLKSAIPIEIKSSGCETYTDEIYARYINSKKNCQYSVRRYSSNRQ